MVLPPLEESIDYFEWGAANNAYFALEDMDIGIIDIAKRIKNKEYAKFSKKINQ